MSAQPLYETTCEQLAVSVYHTNEEMGAAAAREARGIIQTALAAASECDVILATGNSQLTFLAALRTTPGIDWSRVNVFHMDEYVGLDPTHPASFPLFLRRHLVDRVKPKSFFAMPDPTSDPELACRAYEALLRAHPATLCVLGIGENGHLAFNDPPFVDFDDPLWVKLVALDPVSRMQQVKEGHFPSLDAVPTHAITLTIPALRAAKRMICLVPESRKAEAVRKALHEPVSPACPATILRSTAHCHLYLDADAARGILPVP